MAITEWDIRRDVIGQGNAKVILCDDDPVFLQEFHREVDTFRLA